MFSLTLICMGKLKEKFYIQASEEYKKRLGAFCDFTLLELPEVRLPEHPTPTQVEGALAREGEALLAKLPKSAKVIALCVEGVQLSSPALAAQMEQWMVEGASHLTLIIGGSFGLHPSVKEAAHLRLSMSPMTFPHHLARVMVLEQVYRAFQIAAGTRYHK